MTAVIVVLLVVAVVTVAALSAAVYVVAVRLLRGLRHHPNPYRATVPEPDAIDEAWALWAPIFERRAEG